MGYKIYKLQNVSEWSGKTPGIVIQEGDPEWEIAYKKWLETKPPTDSKLWKHGIYACTIKNKNSPL